MTSANLTRAAQEKNIELGLIVEGGELPSRIAGHFDRLIADGHPRAAVAANSDAPQAQAAA